MIKNFSFHLAFFHLTAKYCLESIDHLGQNSQTKTVHNLPAKHRLKPGGQSIEQIKCDTLKHPNNTTDTHPHT